MIPRCNFLFSLDWFFRLTLLSVDFVIICPIIGTRSQATVSIFYNNLYARHPPTGHMTYYMPFIEWGWIYQGEIINPIQHPLEWNGSAALPFSRPNWTRRWTHEEEKRLRINPAFLPLSFPFSPPSSSAPFYTVAISSSLFRGIRAKGPLAGR